MRVNRVVRTLILSDFLINSGFSVFAPIFAVFVTRQIVDGSLQAIGFAAGLTQFFKVILQIPIAKYLDRNHGEYDDFISLLMGTILTTMVPFLYFFATNMIHIYFIQALYGISLALAVPPWAAIFTRHIDKSQENIEWSLESISIGISGATAAALGGWYAQHFGFHYLFLIGGVVAMGGAIVQLFVFSDLRAKVRRGQVKPEPNRIDIGA